MAALRVSNGALQASELPTRLKIFNWGDNPSVKGTFKVGEKSARLVELNQRALGFDRVAIDYNHCTVPGSPEYVKGTPPAVFGYGAVKVVPNDGVYLEDVTWTPLGRQHAKNFEDLSPAVHPDKAGEEIDFVHSVALTTNGALRDVTFFSATTNTTTQIEPSKSMPDPIVQTPQAGGLTLALFASAMGLAANASEADITSKLQRLSALEPLAALIKDGKVVVLDARCDGLEQRIKAVETLTAQMSTAGVDRERTEVLARFSADGKVPMGADGKALSNDDMSKLDVGTLRILHANTPATVPLSARGKRPQETQTGNSNLKGLARTAAAFQAQFEQSRPQ